MKILVNGKLRDMTEAEEQDYLSIPKEEDTGLKIEELKQQLADTDYQAIKFAEGWLTVEEYEPIKALRQSWRDEINRLEGSM